MPRYAVQVRFKSERTKEIFVWARDDEEAADKACEIVERWDGVVEADAEVVEEVDE
jgi:hypothetical protein